MFMKLLNGNRLIIAYFSSAVRAGFLVNKSNSLFAFAINLGSAISVSLEGLCCCCCSLAGGNLSVVLR